MTCGNMLNRLIVYIDTHITLHLFNLRQRFI